MMTIKNFAEICNCSAQTLRYYDRIGLLKPIHVDGASGYRYYDDSQLIDFVRIKNLQLAEFSIEEIKRLTRSNEDEILFAFEEKIRAQEVKLKQMIEIQRSYLQEKKMMEKMIGEVSKLLISQWIDPEEWEEIGVSLQMKDQMEETLKNYFMQMFSNRCRDIKKIHLEVNEEKYSEASEILVKLKEMVNEPVPEHVVLGEVSSEEISMDGYEVVWEENGWSHVRDFIEQIPRLEDGKKYFFFFERASGEKKATLSFALCLIGVMLLKWNVSNVFMNCKVEASKDEWNHFKLMVKE